MNAKAKGTRAEHRTMELLEASGYVCMRSAASLGAFDVVGFSLRDVVLVNVKVGQWPGTAEMARLEAFQVPPYARKIVHRWRKGADLPDVREVPWG